MICEIGSEFWSVPVTEKTNSAFTESVQFFLSGRSALKAIITELKGKHTVAMPAWCCDSMIKPFFDAGMQVNFYPIYLHNGLHQEIRGDSDILFVMDYFGYTTDIVFSHPCIIRDVTHSFFSKNYSDADYFFGSLRKWCGFWTGGFGWTKNKRKFKLENSNNTGYVKLRQEAMELKDYYLNGKPDKFSGSVTKNDFLSLFNKAEDLLEDVGVVSASERDIALAEKLDVSFIKVQRRKNAKVLMEAFSKQLIFPTLNKNDCPLFVPIIVPNGKRDELRQFLKQQEIYCPVHWPVSSYHKIDEQTKVLYENELSIVCDQRYTEEDMVRIVDTVKQFWRISG